MNNNLIKDLNALLKHEIPQKEERLLLIEKLVSQFGKTSSLKYMINEKSYLILTKDERITKRLKRYPESPFPLLSTVELFSNSIGLWNSALLQYGLQTRAKLHDLPNNYSEVGTQIFLIHVNKINLRGNRYLRRQYKRLKAFRSFSKIADYWKLSYFLMRESQIYRLASLNSWLPLWYKTISLKELNKIWQTLNSILNYEQTITNIKNVWIESPKGKWRQLGIPPKAWRLYLHMLNQFISYIYSPYLSTEHEGFLYSRGTLSWWQSVLWGDWLKKYNSLIEVDLSSGFPNLSRLYLRKALIWDKLIPLPVINLILTHLNSPLVESPNFPTFETYLENYYNTEWRKGYRSVHMGLGISPILFVITLNWVLKQCKISNPHLKYKWYADDGTFFFNLRGLHLLLRQYNKNLLWILTRILKGENILVSLINSQTQFKESGIIFCRKKSSLIRLNYLWLKPLISLGLKLETSLSTIEQLLQVLTKENDFSLNLYGWTRGRGDNPQTGRRGTLGSKRPLNYLSSNPTSPPLNLTSMLKNYKPYFGYILSLLYASPSSTYSSTLGATPIKKQSLLHYLRKEPTYLELQVNKYNGSSKCNEVILNLWSPTSPTVYSSRLNRCLHLTKSPSLPDSLDSISNPLTRYKNYDPASYYFKKISELPISKEDLIEHKEKYKSLSNTVSTKPNPT